MKYYLIFMFIMYISGCSTLESQKSGRFTVTCGKAEPTEDGVKFTKCRWPNGILVKDPDNNPGGKRG